MAQTSATRALKEVVAELTMFVGGILAQTRSARILKQMVSNFKGY